MTRSKAGNVAPSAEAVQGKSAGALNRSLRIGDEVCWSSQSAGYVKVKRGVIVQVVPAGSRPDREAFPSMYSGDGVGFSRKYESYVVRVQGRGLYWPHVAHLRLVSAP